jgi:hypothetical protein
LTCGDGYRTCDIPPRSSVINGGSVDHEDAKWVAAGALSDSSMQLLAAGNDGNLHHDVRFANAPWQGFRAVQGAGNAATFNGTYPGITGFPWR